MINWSKPLVTTDGTVACLVAGPLTYDNLIKLFDGPTTGHETHIIELEDGRLKAVGPDGRYLSGNIAHRHDIKNAPERTSTFRTFSERREYGAGSLGGCIEETLAAAQALQSTNWEGVVELIREDGKLVDVKFTPNPRVAS